MRDEQHGGDHANHAHQLAGVSGESEQRTIRQLGALKVLGFAQRDAAGRWDLTHEGLEAIANGAAAPSWTGPADPRWQVTDVLRGRRMHGHRPRRRPWNEEF